MTDNRNMELSDEMMTDVTGGTGEASLNPKYKVGDRVHYELTNPANGQTMAVNGSVTGISFENAISMWMYDVKMDPNPYNCTEVRAREDRLSPL